MIIFGIETSCDETACAVVEGSAQGVRDVCSVVASSKDFHEKTGGIVPEVAARKQVEFMVPVLNECLRSFGGPPNIDAVAVTVGPGLIGSLIVGVEAAKALSLALNKPLIPVNHLIGHIYGAFVGENSIEFPAIALVVSGGHTDLVLMKGHGDFEFLGGTLDDAAGESFDKVARLLGLSKYLGGKLLSDKASECKENTIDGVLPRPMLNQDNFDFSFSGLKTATKKLIDSESYSVEVIAREFENAVIDVLVAKTLSAVKKFRVKSLIVGGGVAANTVLRKRFEDDSKEFGINLFISPAKYCTDNAVTIATAAYFNNKSVEIEKIEPSPSLGITDLL